MRRIFTIISSVTHTVMCVLQEVFDEAAYARFLARTKASSSRTAYAAFCLEREAASARRTRCC